jgi:hypothetical protein
MRYRHRNGQSIWFEITHSNLLNDQAHRVVRSEMVDVSERMDAVERLRAGEQLLRRLTEALPLGVVQIDANRTIVYATNSRSKFSTRRTARRSTNGSPGLRAPIAGRSSRRFARCCAPGWRLISS